MRKFILRTLSALTAVFCLSTLNMPVRKAEAETETKLMALTFDDGPNTTTTNEVLDVLEKYNAKGSFFLIGDNINDESAESVKRAYDMGCEIDNHSKSHPNMGSMSAEEILAEVEYVNEKVIEITGEAPKFFRPPFIDVSQTMYDTIDLPMICGIDCQDYMENVTAQQRADYIVNGARDGVIVLLHDASGNSQTVEALEIAMPILIEQGYEFVTLTELFERQGETPRGDMIYTCVAKYPCEDYIHHRNIFEGEATGDGSWSGWNEKVAFDLEELSQLEDTYAIEIEYSGSTNPVIALQKWSGTAIWQTVQPYYFNGERAVFLASDLIPVLESLEIDYTDLDRLGLMPHSGTMTVTSVDILVKDKEEESTVSQEKIMGDVNADGEFNVADLVALQNYLVRAGRLADYTAGDYTEDNKIDVFDLIEMRMDFIA